MLPGRGDELPQPLGAGGGAGLRVSAGLGFDLCGQKPVPEYRKRSCAMPTMGRPIYEVSEPLRLLRAFGVAFSDSAMTASSTAMDLGRPSSVGEEAGA